jgi:hypothetical protein
MNPMADIRWPMADQTLRGGQPRSARLGAKTAGAGVLAGVGSESSGASWSPTTSAPHRSSKTIPDTRKEH